MSSTAIGLLACTVSSLFFGSMFVPIKKFDAGNGLFTQWIMGITILFVGFFTNFYHGLPPFQPLAMLGGVSWTIGNILAVPIISYIGLGQGMLVWGSVNCVIGWACGRFGLFDTTASIPNSPVLNYIGLIFVVIGGILFSKLKSTTRLNHSDSTESFGPVEDVDEESALLNEAAAQHSQATIEDKTSKFTIIGIILSVISGIFYGLTFVPVSYIQKHPLDFPGAPTDAIAFAFSHYSGIFITSTLIMIGYIIFSKNKPVINHEIILPSMLTGFMWAVAQLSWFVANDALSQAITFPIISMIPGVIGACWSVFYFQEITGTENIKILMAAIGITLFGAIMVGLSKDI
uniref:Transmembrane protein 144 homolog n=1 Tax=Rhabditophanes sp. KR3021 TaxID=114890 RepID=A0AC35U0F4_9BILA